MYVCVSGWMNACHMHMHGYNSSFHDGWVSIFLCTFKDSAKTPKAIPYPYPCTLRTSQRSSRPESFSPPGPGGPSDDYRSNLDICFKAVHLTSIVLAIFYLDILGGSSNPMDVTCWIAESTPTSLSANSFPLSSGPTLWLRFGLNPLPYCGSGANLQETHRFFEKSHQTSNKLNKNELLLNRNEVLLNRKIPSSIQ